MLIKSNGSGNGSFKYTVVVTIGMQNRICEACGTDGAENNGFCSRCNREGDEAFFEQHGTPEMFSEPEDYRAQNSDDAWNTFHDGWLADEPIKEDD